MFLNSLFLSLSQLFNAKALRNEKKHDAAELGVNIFYTIFSIYYTICYILYEYREVPTCTSRDAS